MNRSTIIAAALLAVAAAPTLAFELQHTEGALRLDAAPKKIVTFDLGVLDTLGAFDVPVAGVPKSNYEGALARYQDHTVVGTLFEPDYAVLEQIQPDLIVSGSRSMTAVPKLQEVAPTVSFRSDTNAFLDSFRQTNLALGKAFGKEEQAAAALANIDGNVKALHAANKGKTGAMLFTVKGNVIAHAPGDRFGYAYELAGLESVLPATDPNTAAAPRPAPDSPEAKAAAKKRAQALTAVAAAEPDWLIVLDRGAINGAERTAAATLAKHPEISRTKAFKENRVYYADPNGWYIVGGGLNNMKAITDSMLAAMK